MKKEKYLKFFTKRIPENEWEAKYINDSTKNYFALYSYFVFILLFGVAVVAIVSTISTCEIETSGNIEGNLSFDTGFDENLEKVIKNFEISKVNGNAHIKMPCGWLKIFLGGENLGD
jgi:hypothetical protein